MNTYRLTTIGPDGTATVTDPRDFAACAAEQLAWMREACEEQILAGAPEYRQRNAALGLLTEEERQAVLQVIAAARSRYELRKAAINAITWDGTEGTRAAACDAIQAVTWEDP